MGAPNDTYTFCKRYDCQLNFKGKCFGVKESAVLKNGTRHYIDLEQCPFYKQKEKKK